MRTGKPFGRVQWFRSSRTDSALVLRLLRSAVALRKGSGNEADLLRDLTEAAGTPDTGAAMRELLDSVVRAPWGAAEATEVPVIVAPDYNRARNRQCVRRSSRPLSLSDSGEIR